MKTLTLEVPDDVYERAERRAAELGSSLQEECVELVARLSAEQDNNQLTSQRTQLEELFRSTQGFRMGSKIPREELYERGRVH